MSVNIYNSNPNATSEEENFTLVADRGSKLASDTIYSNTTSGLNSVNVQGAIDEVNEKVEDNVEAISQINSDLTETNNKLVLGNGIKSLELPLIPGYIVFDQRLADNTVYRVAFDIPNKTILFQFINTDGTLTNLATWQGV